MIKILICFQYGCNMSKKKKLSDIDLEILNNPPYPLQDPIKWMKWKAMKPSERKYYKEHPDELKF